MKHIFLSSVCAAMLAAGGCASTPDPAKVCSADWVGKRADKAMGQFKRDARPIFKTLKKLGARADSGGSIGPVQMFSLMNAMKRLGSKIENGRAMRDMRTLATTCDDPDLIKNAMTDFMREQGIDEKFINFLNNFESYARLLETGVKPKIKY